MKHTFLFFLLFIFLYFVFRVPYLIAPLTGEEGILANIFYTQPPNPNYLIIGRINGIDIYTYPQHPAIIYEILSHFGLLWKMIINYKMLNIASLTFFVRLAFSMFQFLVVAVIALMTLQRRDIVLKDRITPFSSIVILAVSVPAMIISTFVQVDGSVGTLLSGLLAIALLGYRLNLFPIRIASIFIFLSSLLFGLGKNEWSLALLLALLLTAAYIYITTKKKRGGGVIKFSIALGCYWV